MMVGEILFWATVLFMVAVGITMWRCERNVDEWNEYVYQKHPEQQPGYTGPKAHRDLATRDPRGSDMGNGA